MRIVGISAFYHDSAAALVQDGRIVAAAQEERFTRKKFDEDFPEHAIRYCLDAADVRLRDVDHVVFYDKPFVKFERLLETYIAFAPRGFKSFCKAMPVWLGEKLTQKRVLTERLQHLDSGFNGERLLFAEHHHSHAASAFYPSPFDQALVLTIDGVGEHCTTMAAIGHGRKIDVLKEIRFPHSLGLLYSAFTSYIGFRVNSGEYKLMGLAPYGEPRFRDRILDNLIDLKPDGSFKLDMAYFNYCTGLTMTNQRFDALFGMPPRLESDPLAQTHMDIAASIQAVLEEAILRLTRSLAAEHKQKNLCLAGGVALNCVANGKILRDGKFERIWIQPAAGDAGGALGAALLGYHLFAGAERPASGPSHSDAMSGSYLGPSYSEAVIQERLTTEGARFEVVADEAALIDRTARALAGGKAVGWFQGRMEFGPRALGNRSILADPRNPEMQKILNLKVKYRESFRPFAPAVLFEDVRNWFDLDEPSPYMLLVADVAERHRIANGSEAPAGLDKLNALRSTVPAITHVDNSARIQTVHRETNPRFHALLSEFKRRTGCPILINTSFNVRGEPIACTPEDAFRCLMGTEIEMLVIGNCILQKEWQNSNLVLNYRDAFDPD
jgi:carbamoyltransferase